MATPIELFVLAGAHLCLIAVTLAVCGQAVVSWRQRDYITAVLSTAHGIVWVLGYFGFAMFTLTGGVL